MPDKFSTALDFVHKWEGGYVDHPSDPGGATNMGITQATLAEWRGLPVSKQDVQDLGEPEARQIYRAKYWAAVQADALAGPVAIMTFDAAVNMGPARAGRILQRALVALGHGVAVDGAIGPRTLASAGNADALALATEMAAQRLHYYATRDHAPAFMLGWSRRVVAALVLALEWPRLDSAHPPSAAKP